MKKFLMKLILFVSVTFLTYPLLIFIWFQYINSYFGLSAFWPVNHFTYTMQEILQKKPIDKVDYLVIGSSHAYCSFDPKIFEENHLNIHIMGSSAQKPTITQYLIHDYLKKIKPDFVIYEVYPGPLINKGLEAIIDFSFNYHFPKISDNIQLFFEFPEVRVLNGLIYRVFADFLGKDLKADVPKNFYKGYIPNPQKVKISHIDFPSRKWEFHGEIKKFEENIQLIKDMGSIPILVYAPIPKKIYHSYTNHNELDNYFKKVAQKYNIKYFNFNNLDQILDDEHFFDKYGHLNHQGVSIFNPILMDSLKTNNLIP